MEELKGVYNTYKYYTDPLHIEAKSIAWSPKSEKESYLLVGGEYGRIMIIDNYTSSREHGVHYPLGIIELDSRPWTENYYTEAMFGTGSITTTGEWVLDPMIKKEILTYSGPIVGLSMPDSPVYYKEIISKGDPQIVTTQRLIIALMDVDRSHSSTVSGGKSSNDYLLVCISWYTLLNMKTFERVQKVEVDNVYPFRDIYNDDDMNASYFKENALGLVYYHPKMDVLFVGIPGLDTGVIHALSISEYMGKKRTMFKLEPWIGSPYYGFGREGLILPKNIWYTSSLYSKGHYILSHLGPSTTPYSISIISHIPGKLSKFFTQVGPGNIVESANLFELCKDGLCSICQHPLNSSVFYIYTRDGYSARLEFGKEMIIEKSKVALLSSMIDAVDPFVDLRSSIGQMKELGLFCSFSNFETDRIYFINTNSENKTTTIYYMFFKPTSSIIK